MGKHSKKEDLNTKPYNPQATDQQKADEFDRQYAENQSNGNAKESTGQYRPEPSQADREPKGKW